MRRRSYAMDVAVEVGKLAHALFIIDKGKPYLSFVRPATSGNVGDVHERSRREEAAVEHDVADGCNGE